MTYSVKLSITSLSVNVQINLLLKALAIFAILLSLGGCNDSEGRPCARTEDACIIEEPEPIEAWWDVPIPDFSENPDRPDVTILGERTIILNLGEFYLEQGALASDEQDGNITPQIVIKGEVNTDIVGDYLLRYTVTDTSGLDAIEKVRIIRVVDEIAASLTRRALGTTTANFGYFEHLPLNYGQPESMNSSPTNSSGNKPPLIIYLHGSGGNLEFVQDTDPYTSLDAVLENNGIPRLISDGLWNDNLPFVVVAPHLGAVPGFGYKDRLDAFVEYAIRAYDIDINRVYMTGWSSGGYLSSAYAVDFPEKIAAIAPIASGLSTDIENLPSDFCNIEQVPVWLFHGTGDQVTPFVNSINAYNAIIDKCSARVLPKLSLLMNARHHMHHVIYDRSALAGSVIDDITVEYDPRYDPYEPDIYEWLLSHSLEDR